MSDEVGDVVATVTETRSVMHCPSPTLPTGTGRILRVRTVAGATTLELELSSRERFDLEIPARRDADFPRRLSRWGRPIAVVIATNGSWCDCWTILTGVLGPRRLSVELAEALALVEDGVHGSVRFSPTSLGKPDKADDGARPSR